MKFPYQYTSIAPEKTQADIVKMLYLHGAEATRWTSEKDGKTVLEFIFKVEGNPIAFRITPALLEDSKGVNVPASMRLLYWWLKSMLEAVRYGLISVEEAFLANIAGSLPSGETVTVGDMLLPRLRSGEVLGPSELHKALPSAKEVKE